MQRRQGLTLGAIGSGLFALGGLTRLGGTRAFAQTVSVPTVDRLVMTNVVDNIYDVFAKAGRLDTITVQRTPLSTTRRAPSFVALKGIAESYAYGAVTPDKTSRRCRYRAAARIFRPERAGGG